MVRAWPLTIVIGAVKVHFVASYKILTFSLTVTSRLGKACQVAVFHSKE